ncbi:unnamed protein product [Effrenium voratum]|nr:unnamed protein product [Effrenium voratum]
MPHPAVREMETTLMPNHLPLEHIQLDMNQEDYDMRNEDLTPGPGAFTSPPSNCPAGAVQHPQKWSEDQVREWWEKRTKRRPNVEGLSKGTDGRNIMRWNMNRFEQMTKGDSHLAMALYQDLRNEVQRFEHFRKTGVVLKASPIAVPEKRTSKKENFQPPVRREVTEVKAATAPREKRPAVGLKKEPSVKRAVPKAMRRASSNSGTKMTHAVTTKSEGAPERLACARARSSSRPSPERKCKSMQPEPEPEERRTMVMEDLADAALHRLSSPTKREVSIHSARSHKSEPERKAEEVSRRPKSARLKADKEDEEETRQMFDKRELRKRHKDLFEDYVQRWRQRQPETPPNEAEPCRVRVYVRKRPLFGYEQEAEEFDVATAKGRKIVIHNCLTKADLRSLFISHMGFQFAEVFGEAASDEEVYQSTACPAVQHLLQNKVATLFMFGQTGSGKPHTLGGPVPGHRSPP